MRRTKFSQYHRSLTHAIHSCSICMRARFSPRDLICEMELNVNNWRESNTVPWSQYIGAVALEEHFIFHFSSFSFPSISHDRAKKWNAIVISAFNPIHAPACRHVSLQEISFNGKCGYTQLFKPRSNFINMLLKDLHACRSRGQDIYTFTYLI